MPAAWNRLSSPAALLVLLAALAGWCFLGVPEVSVVRPERGDAAEVVYATGVVEPHNWAKVVALSRKRIVEICSCEGKAVKKGQVLARLDDVQERATLSEMQARRNTIKEDVERLSGLLRRNVATQVDYDEKVTQLQEIDARITVQTNRIADLELKAPMDGIVLKKDGEVGEIAGIDNKDVLFWVGEPRPLEISADVNEEDIAKVTVGQKALLRHDGFPGVNLAASVQHITPKGDPETKTFNVTLALPDDTPLKIGMSVEANIVVKEAKGVFLVPAESVSGKTVLSIINGRIKPVPVTVGIRGSRMVEIASGLDGTELIVAPASAELRSGMRVRAKETAAP